jgi:hypothetical protein
MRRRFPALLVALGLSAATLAAVPGAAAQARPTPPMGSILGAPTLFTAHPDIADEALLALKIKFQTSLSDDQPVPSTGVVIRPKHNFNGYIVVKGHGTDGLGDVCAPSRHPNLDADPKYDFYVREVVALLRAGYTVAVPDYPGLGTPGIPPYMAGDGSGRSMVDAARAARRLLPNLTNKVAFTGHSEGGRASLMAAEVASTSYGHGLSFQGVASTAPAAELHILGPGAIGFPDPGNPNVPFSAFAPGQGYVVMAIYGLARIDPTVQPAQILAPPALSPKARDIALHGCLNDVVEYFQAFRPDELLRGGQLSPELVLKLEQHNPGHRPIAGPVLLAGGADDTLVPPFVVSSVQGDYCTLGVPTQAELFPGEHSPMLDSSREFRINWLADRFAGVPLDPAELCAAA